MDRWMDRITYRSTDRQTDETMGEHTDKQRWQ